MTSIEKATVRVTERSRRRRTPLVVVSALALVAGLVVCLGVVGSDALWLSASGDAIRSQGHVAQGVPFAAAPTGHWVNTTVMGQLLFSVVFQLGSVGILLAQLIAVILALGIVVGSALRDGAAPGPAAAVIVVVSIGAAAPLLIARAQLLSLVPYAILLAMVRRQHVKPDAGIWWAVPLVALWSNLHGAVLVGGAVLGAYLLLSRLRVQPVRAIAVGVASLAATCLNPGLLDAPRYYFGVFTGQATSDDTGMWSRISPTNPLDVLLVLAAVVLAVVALRRRRPLWEYAAGLGLLVATLSASRHGVWLLLFLAVPTALGINRRTDPAQHRRRYWEALPVPLLALLLVSGAALMSFRAPSLRAADMEARQVAEATRGQVVLAPEPLSESLAAAGASVWASNPLDAFEPADQSAYLAFLKGDAMGAGPALRQADMIVALSGTAQARMALASGYTESGQVGRFTLLRKE